MKKQLSILVIILTCLASAAGAMKTVPPKKDSYFTSHVQPIFQHRCIACHACETAPCQLKLDTFEGLDRGAINIYPKGFTHKEKPMTRMFKDAKTTQGWREKSFWPVVERSENLTGQQRLLA